MLLVVKTRSIDVTMDPQAVVAQEAGKLKKNGFQIDQIINLEPFDRDHSMIYCIYNSKASSGSSGRASAVAASMTFL